MGIVILNIVVIAGLLIIGATEDKFGRMVVGFLAIMVCVQFGLFVQGVM